MLRGSMKKVTQQEIFTIAAQLAAQEKMPTISSVRSALGGRGSVVTIHKYLQQWKKKFLKAASKNQEDNATVLTEFTTVVDKKNTLEQALISLTNQNKRLTVGLIRSEKEAIGLKEQNQIFKNDLTEITEKHQILTLKCEHLEKLYNEITTEREVMKEIIITDKDRQITALQKELRETHQESLDKIKILGFEGDDALIREKVKVIQLEDKLGILTEKIKSLEAELQIAKERVQPLVQQIQRQKTFIQKVVTWEQMQEYEKEFKEELWRS